MDLIRDKARGRASGVVISIFDMGYVDVPVVLMLVTDHGKHLHLGMVDTFNAAVSTWVVGTGREFVYAE